MSVARMREIVKRMRALGVKVHEAPGAWSRGNGMSPAYAGIVNHHTATSKQNANLGILIHGRSDLSGPLCNFCTWANGDLGMIAAFPANHAGASGGWDTAPLPRTSVFNKYVIGNEIIYEGTAPMTDAQMRTSLLLSKVAVQVCGNNNAQRVKFHQGTSITGKWDPGFAPGQTYSIGNFRTAMRDVQEDDVTDDDINKIAQRVWGWNVGNPWGWDGQGDKPNQDAYVALSYNEQRLFNHMQNVKNDLWRGIENVKAEILAAIREGNA